MKIQSVLIFVENPTKRDDAATGQRDTWTEFLCSTQGVVKQNQNIKSLNGTLFVLQLENEVSLMTRILEAARRNNLNYRVLFLEEGTQWLTSSSDSQA